MNESDQTPASPPAESASPSVSPSAESPSPAESPSAESPPPPPRDAGRRLKAARERWGLSVQEVAQCFNLGVDTIEALERDDYSGLPGATFAVGYLRAYAKLLKLDPEEIVGAARLEAEQAQKIPYAKVPLREAPRGERPVKRTGTLWGALWVAVALAAAAVVVSQSGVGVNEVLEMLNLSPVGG